ncbi:MAG: tryptophan--tRNA ligase [bacterium]|nr:tryptophan--tRNA ligase [bacterium]
MNTNKVTPITDPNEIADVLHMHKTSRPRDAGWSAFAEPKENPEKVTNESLVLHCTKCNINTAGIYPRTTDKVRRCPMCNSLLMYCPVCRNTVSATEKFSVISCDRCSADFVTNSTIEYLASRDHAAREIVLSGIRATGELHLGNYLGAVRQFVEYEAGDNLCMYFIADWHTLTTCQNSQQISVNSIAIATDYLAAGLNPERSIIYTQSSVPEIAELALYLAMFQSKNQLEDMPTLKDLVRGRSFVSMGHLYYPVLMAADILGPRATVIPVGSDQVPNVELAIGIARKFNGLFGQTFVIPRVGLRTIKVPGLTGDKMGKSEKVSSVSLSDSLETISDKYLRYGVTDAGKRARNDPGDPNNCTSVYPVYKILRENNASLGLVEKECRSGVRGCRECKLELAKDIDALVEPFRERRTKLSQNKKYVEEVLHFGGMKAREIIEPTVREVREKLGIISV